MNDLQIFIEVWPLYLSFDQLLFKMNMKLGVDFRGLLLQIWNVKFVNFGVFLIYLL